MAEFIFQMQHKYADRCEDACITAWNECLNYHDCVKCTECGQDNPAAKNFLEELNDGMLSSS